MRSRIHPTFQRRLRTVTSLAGEKAQECDEEGREDWPPHYECNLGRARLLGIDLKERIKLLSYAEKILY
jgi:hypothetical protein